MTTIPIRTGFERVICGWCLREDCDDTCPRPGPLVIPPAQYDQLAAEGVDMRDFVKSELLPEDGETTP